MWQRPAPSLGMAGWIAVALLAMLIGGWEAWVRVAQQVEPSYRNSDGLWAEQRRRIDHGEGDGWVAIGSSRMLFNLQLPAWEAQTGQRPIQLALEGTSPVGVLEQLADDPDFTGKLLVGVAPGLFFSGYEYRAAAIEHYQTETPAQWFGQQVSLLIEPWLAFYNFDYALPAMVRRQPWPARDGVETEIEVRKISNMERDRNTRMWGRVVDDPDYQALARHIWAQNWVPLAELPEPVRARILESRDKQIQRAAAAVAKLHRRDVPVVFVQMPYTGHYAKSEPDIAPRELTWDRLIEETDAPGLHFMDHIEMQGYDLPEWSHMSASEADRFTARFQPLVERTVAAHYPREESP
ncbi:MAG: hypothetical protein Tsb0027_21720 [Wenzhouxiangellaceae bacterium]